MDLVMKGLREFISKINGEQNTSSLNNDLCFNQKEYSELSEIKKKSLKFETYKNGEIKDTSKFK